LTLVTGAEVLKAARLTKTVEEVDLIARAAVITEDAIGAAVAIAHEGVTEREMLVAFQRHLVENGADPVIAFIRFGRNGGVSQVPPGDTPLRRGDLIWFDVCADFEGYKSDIARTFALGDPGDRARNYYAALMAAEDAMIEAAVPGRRAFEIFDACVDAARNGGIEHYRRHHVGHAIGLDVYETPLLAPKQDTVLEEHMVLNVEAPYYEIGFGALHVEDPILVRSTGGEVLTRGSRELGIL
jgi:Xaa-Pro aminopeptidase